MLNAILNRELTTVLRTRRMMFFQVGLIAVFVLLVMIRWPTDNRVTEASNRSQQVFRLFSYGLLTTMLLILPVFPATNIVREKKQGTLALLLNSPLGPFRIYFGKLFSILALAGILLALSMPAAAACYCLGGLSLTEELPRVYAILALVALQYSAVGLYISSRSNSIDGAIRFTYGVILALAVVSLGPHKMLQGTDSDLATYAEWLRCVSPIAALMPVLGAADVGGQGLLATDGVPGRFALLSIVITVLASIGTILRLNHTIFDQSRAQGKISDDQNLFVRIVRRAMFLVDPQRRSGGISWFVNPVMIKEFRCRRFGRLHWLLRLVAVCAILSLVMAYVTTSGTLDWEVSEIGGLMVYLQVALVVLITPSLAAGLIATELESGGWPLLQTTPMSALRIVWGKLLSVILTLILLLFATLPGYIVMVYIDNGMRSQVERVVICLAATAGFAMLLSAGIGSLFRRTAPATVAAYTTLIAICAGPLLVWAGRDAPFGHNTVERVLIMNPVAAPLSVIRAAGFENYNLIPGNWWFMGLVSAASMLVLVFRTQRLWKPR
ncbi:MAG: ABC transporter permease [Planctomycetes bacterium]|nr:ABC transporter permease [Planctomycetota bacterium]